MQWQALPQGINPGSQTSHAAAPTAAVTTAVTVEPHTEAALPRVLPEGHLPFEDSRQPAFLPSPAILEAGCGKVGLSHMQL